MPDFMISDEELLLKKEIRRFALSELEPHASEFDSSGKFPRKNIEGLANLGLTGLTIDEKYGGVGGTSKQLAIVAEEIARGCGSTSVIFLAHLSLCTQFINTYGTEEQKTKYLSDLISAKSIGAFALTEPGAGSDSAKIATSLHKVGGEYLLNGTKLYTTNAKEADVFVIIANRDIRLNRKGIVALILERGAEGFVINPQSGKMGMRASSTAELVFNNTPVPEKNIIGEGADGFKKLMDILNGSRIGIAAQGVGLAQAAYDVSVSYAKQRSAFGNKLDQFQAIQWMIADMATDIEASRMLVYKAAEYKDDGLKYAKEASMAKLLSSRVAVESANKAVQIHGGLGYFAPTVAERLYRDSKVTEIYEGTSEIQRMIISKEALK
ncbi:MAG: acyl-CoA dehydrogenase [SAR202 cluster bacterium]|nr:acyl-CoA dehydrogenase [Chloroflexota bacterium]MQG39731.1 acyl-CoA dehydrogenase [SAR202 cluster bacterium]|tara:strand:+ start:3406 stop:4548 length:1143 start_codon:yes stop_codon:yes gene_type:complete